jgi:hypothetical protein
VRLFAAFVFLSTLALAQTSLSPSGGPICPLSDSQTQKSIEAFSKLTPIFQQPRCINCHGAVDPFSKGGGHAGGEFAFVRSEDGFVQVTKTFAPCGSCHNAFEGWRTPPSDMFFIGKDSVALCKLMKRQFGNAGFFMGHMIKDNGQEPFIEVGFAGTRGMSDTTPEPPPDWTQSKMIKLSQEWVDAMGGSYQGGDECGCVPAHYAIQMNASTEHSQGPIYHKSAMQPIEVPIAFQDDGTFSGEGLAQFGGAATVSTRAGLCQGGYADSLKIRVSGQAIQTSEQRSMKLKLENTSPDVSSVSGQCPSGSFSKQDTHPGKTILPFDLEGNVGEFLDYSMPEIAPGFKSTMHLEIVKLAEPQK